MTHIIEQYGLAFLFLIVALESAGLPLPGETALIAAAILAASGHFSIAAVIAVAAAGAILGDNAGYWIGRKAGRRFLMRWERLHGPLQWAERFFARHGGKAVFLARFITGLRVAGAWMAGISHMNWWRFLGWNAAGGIAWAALVGVVAYVFGRAAADAVGKYGLIGGGILVGLAGLALVGVHLWRRRAGRPEQA